MQRVDAGVPFINGAPQNTFVPGLIELAVQRKVLVGGDDFKSGQTKMKSVLVDFLVGAGIKPTSIVSYNHLGNNDGMNLSAPQTFRSKEISKSNVVDDMVASNSILYAPGKTGAAGRQWVQKAAELALTCVERLEASQANTFRSSSLVMLATCRDGVVHAYLTESFISAHCMDQEPGLQVVCPWIDSGVETVGTKGFECERICRRAPGPCGSHQVCAVRG